MSMFEELLEVANTTDLGIELPHSNMQPTPGRSNFEQPAGQESKPHRSVNVKKSSTSGRKTELQVAQLLEQAAVPEVFHNSIRELHDEDAEGMLTSMQRWLDETQETHALYRPVIYLLIKLASTSLQFPTSLYLSGATFSDQFSEKTWGGFAEVYRGDYNGSQVALKCLRDFHSGESREEIHKQICREALVWRQLKHPNILPFLGLQIQTHNRVECIFMVSPWMKNGTLMNYIRSSKYDAKLDRDRLLFEVCTGLQYLHSLKTVHGDIRGDNILVDDEGHARITDFGLAIVGSATAGRCTTNHSTAGSIRFTSPERIRAYAKGVPPPRRTPADDIYAFGCLYIEVATGRVPFPDIPDSAVQFRVKEGKSPPRPLPGSYLGHPINDGLWKLITRCLSKNPKSRPSASIILQELSLMHATPELQDLPDTNTPAGPALLTRSRKRLRGKDLALAMDSPPQSKRAKPALNVGGLPMAHMPLKPRSAVGTAKAIDESAAFLQQMKTFIGSNLSLSKQFGSTSGSPPDRKRTRPALNVGGLPMPHMPLKPRSAVGTAKAIDESEAFFQQMEPFVGSYPSLSEQPDGGPQTSNHTGTPENARPPARNPEHNEMRRLLAEMQMHPSGWPFLQPVSKKEVPDYHEVIDRPMDFRTMEHKLEANQYSTMEAFIADAQLTFDNCKAYNPGDTVYAKSARNMEQWLMQQTSDRAEKEDR